MIYVAWEGEWLGDRAGYDEKSNESGRRVVSDNEEANWWIVPTHASNQGECTPTLTNVGKSYEVMKFIGNEWF